MRIHHLAFRTTNLPLLEDFYVGLLGLPARRRCPGSIWLEAGDVVVMLEEGRADEPTIDPRSAELVAFAVEPAQREALLAKLRLAGVAIEGRTEHTHYFRDPDGRRVALSTHPLA